ncbi:MAG: hypothetical protein EHM19_06930 [Candidatus Latescibacterota bacterium]|nr:MAG: hypothetical protein EHM19_06930 [Candidatus Latescibacterota bacterium]
MRKKLAIPADRLRSINQYLTSPDNTLIERFLAIIEKHGGVDEINRKARESGKLKNLLARLEEADSPYLKDLAWLQEAKDKGSFVSMAAYRDKALAGAKPKIASKSFAVTLEISALNFFPWLITEAKRAIAERELMPGRYIRVRSMKESCADNGDVLAVAAAMRIVGATYVETLDTKGTDGSNVHLGGPATITGYFGGVGQPNEYALKWTDEFLHYYTNYGTCQVLNINPGTVFLGYMMHKLGIDNEFKISVYMGNDNPYAVLWTLLAAKLFSRDDGTTPLIGFNFSNSVTNETIELCAEVRGALDFEKVVRFEHHITETWKSIVRQPYIRRDELVDVARKVKNISAKHEGGDPEVEQTLEHPSDILEYFLPKADIVEKGLMPALERNYIEKHVALNRTARALLKNGIPVVAAKALHK